MIYSIIEQIQREAQWLRARRDAVPLEDKERYGQAIRFLGEAVGKLDDAALLVPLAHKESKVEAVDARPAEVEAKSAAARARPGEAAARAIAVLGDGKWWRGVELAGRVGCSVAAAQNLLCELRSKGLVEQRERRGPYRLVPEKSAEVTPASPLGCARSTS